MGNVWEDLFTYVNIHAPPTYTRGAQGLGLAEYSHK